jgi:hypothetical protein
MKFKYKGDMPGITAGIITKPRDTVTTDNTVIIKELKLSPLFEIVKEDKRVIKKVKED